MKKILFPVSNRVHLARQQLLLKELKKSFDLKIVDCTDNSPASMSEKVGDYADFWLKILEVENPDFVLLRGDRYEILPLATVTAYRGIKIAHIEGGDLSGVIDNKVRHAVTKLADIHFVTNKEAHSRVVAMGVDPENVYNFGSLDVEYALSVKPNRPIEENYAVIAFHPIPGEDGKLLENLKLKGLKIINITSNKDYGMEYKGEEYESDRYINLLRYAELLIGNSSSFIKEASVFGVPVIDIGERQDNRLKPRNVLHIPYSEVALQRAIKYQLGMKYKPSRIYSKDDTSKKIAEVLREL